MQKKSPVPWCLLRSRGTYYCMDTRTHPEERAEGGIPQTEPWESLTLANNFMFCKVMETNPDICREVVELLLGISVDRVEIPQGERTMQPGYMAKGIRLDVYCRTPNEVIDLEMQTTARHDLPRRARYYQSVMDIDAIQSGEKYTQLKDSYVVFLCMRDPLGRGLPVYRFENVCLADPGLRLGDGARKVFFNAEKCDRMEGENLRAFFRFLKGRKPATELTARLDTIVERTRQDAKMRGQYMMWSLALDDERYEAHEAGLAEGLAEGIKAGRLEGINSTKLEATRNLLMNGVGAEVVAKSLGIPLEMVLEIQKGQDVSL